MAKVKVPEVNFYYLFFVCFVSHMSVVCARHVCITTPEALVLYNVSYMICRSGTAGFVYCRRCTSVSKSILAPLSDIAFARGVRMKFLALAFAVAYYRIDTRRVIKHV